MKTIFKLSIYLIILSLGLGAQAQQDPLYSQYMFNLLTINPAYAGNREVLSTTALYRSNFSNPKSAPQTMMFTADWSLPQKKIGLGVHIYNDDLVLVKNTGFYGIYSYRIHMRAGTLSLGLHGGASRYNLNNDLLLNDYSDPVFAQNQDKWQLNIGTGLFFNTDRMYVGLSAPNVLGHGQVRTNSENDKIHNQSTHWFLTGGYVFNLGPDLALKPSSLVAMVPGAPIHVDLNLNLWFYNIASIGASYRTDRAVVGMVELQLNPQLRFGYAYDHILGDFNHLNSSEIMVRYEFGKTKTNLISPRHF